MSTQQQIVDIGKYKVPFPYKPYQIQIDFMSKILNSLENNDNALLESPTGSGKTLSLLAPVLAYLNTLPNNKPTVYFTSRTHSQLKQAIDQLKLLTTLNATTLASRNHLCLNKDVKDLPSGLASIKCKIKTNYKSKESCLYYEGFKRNQSQLKHLKLADIEDLTSHGRKSNICPYFTSRLLTSQVDFVFLPYNYLFDLSKSDHFLVNVNLQSGELDVKKENDVPIYNNKSRNGAIIIFDEAHNLESVALNATSFEVSIQDLTSMSGELKYCGSLMEEYQLDVNYFDPIHQLIFNLSKFIKNIEFPKSNGYNNNNQVIKDASCMMQLFNESGISLQSVELIEKAVEMLSENNSNRLHLNVLIQGIRILYINTNTNHFKISIEKQFNQQFNKQNNSTVLKYYCLHSGIAMNILNDLRDKQGNKLIKSFILASGTLSPLDSFAFESGLHFNQTLSNPHVINPYQLCIRSNGLGPLKHTLSSTFDKRNDVSYLEDLGVALVQIQQQVKGGMLVFFPAYQLMEKCMQHWKQCKYKTTTIHMALTSQKSLFIESKDRDEFTKIINQFELAAISKGAILFAVCRGKASEGIDFRNDKCRAVVCIGFPFPNLGDAKVGLKKSYMDQLFCKKPRLQGVVSGSEWYKQQAIRAINQAIGRVIRHKYDYGCIILLDQRFQDSTFNKYLPLWIRPYFVQNQRFEDTINAMQSFFRNPKLKELQREPTTQVPVPANRVIKPHVPLQLDSVKKRQFVEAAPKQSLQKKAKTMSRQDKKLEAKAFMDQLRQTISSGQFSIFKQNLVKLNNKEMTSILFAEEIIGFMKTSGTSAIDQRTLLSKLATFIPSESRHHYLGIVNSFIRK